MESVINGIETLFTSIRGTAATRVEKLPQSGSDRIYFRIYEGSKTYIATYNLNQKETSFRTCLFFYFSLNNKIMIQLLHTINNKSNKSAN